IVAKPSRGIRKGGHDRISCPCGTQCICRGLEGSRDVVVVLQSRNRPAKKWIGAAVWPRGGSCRNYKRGRIHHLIELCSLWRKHGIPAINSAYQVRSCGKQSCAHGSLNRGV